MGNENNIVLVCNNKSSAENIKGKLVLLRDIDSIHVAKYFEAFKVFEKAFPDCIIMHCDEEKEEVLALIKKVREDLVLKNTPIILIIKEFEREFMLSAFDEGISDYITQDANEAEILMRIIWALKKNNMYRIIENRKELLCELNVLDKNTGIYSQDYTEKVFAGEIKDVFKYKSYACLVVVSPDVDSKNKLSPTLLASVVTKCTRNSDIIGQGEDGKFYLLLLKTKASGVITVYERIKKELTPGTNICIGAFEIEKKISFEKILAAADEALYEALSEGEPIIFVEEEKPQKTAQWLDKMNSGQKNFKLFKQAFIRKLENVITPVFYQMQKKLEVRMVNTKIEQTSSEAISTFSMQKDAYHSVLKITHPGFAKVNIDIMNVFGREQFEDRQIIELSELNELKLIEIFDKMVRDFTSKTNA